MLLRKCQNWEKGCVILIICVFTALAVSPPVFALDFSSSSGLGNICYIGRLSDGNILAVDSSGEAAVFNYLEWTTVHPSIGSFRDLQEDPNGAYLLGTKVEGFRGNLGVPYKYDIARNTWTQVGPSLGGTPYIFLRNGEIYAVKYSGAEVRLYKLEQNAWTLVSKVTLPRSMEEMVGGSYDPYTDKVVVAVGYFFNGDNYYSATYQFSASNWSYSKLSAREGEIVGIGLFRGIFMYTFCWRIASEGYRSVIVIDGVEHTLCSGDTPVKSVIFTTPEFLAANTEDGIYLYGESIITQITVGFPLDIACCDKFGHIIMGGPNGKVVVRDKGGKLWTDSMLYSEYVIHDTKVLAEEAAAAAKAAEAASVETRNLAQEIKNNTVYQNKSVAYWAYQAAQAANTPPVIAKIQGLNSATCTQGSSFTLTVAASDNGPSPNLRYRVLCGSFDSGWSPASQITITGLTSPGAKTATVMVSDNPANPDTGNIARGMFTFFKV